MLNLKPMFQMIGEAFVKELRDNVARQMDIENQPYSPVAESTLLGRQRSRGLGISSFKKKKMNIVRARKWYQKVASVPNTRLMFHKYFMNHAFKYEPDNQGVLVYVNNAYYGGEEMGGGRFGVTYQDIVAYNQKGSPDVNPKIQRPPLIFPTKFEEVTSMRSWKEAHRLFRAEIRNMQKQIIGDGVKMQQQILL